MKTAHIMYFVSSIKYLVLACLLLFLFLNIKSPAFAQIPPQYNTPNLNSDVPQNQHTWVQSVMLEVMSALSCQLTGMDPLSVNKQCLGYDTQTGKLGYVQTNGGLMSFAATNIGSLFYSPIHTGDSIRYYVQNFGITKPVLAANDGSWSLNSLQPITKLWSLFRNIVYAVFILIFLIIGLAVMFRVKIDPRTVMTIQNQLPRIIIGLILVTFSLAIAALLIDLMYVASYIAVGVFSQAIPGLPKDLGLNLVGSTNPFNALSTVTTDTGGAVFGDLAKNPANAIGGHLGYLFDNDPGRVIIGLITGFIGLSVGGASGIPIIGFVTGIIAGGLGAAGAVNVANTAISIIAYLVIAVTIIASLFRLWFQLIIAYVTILIYIIFAPFWIVAGLIPGSKINFSSWLRSLAANLAAFPATIAMFMLARVFIEAFKGQPANTFVPPLIGYTLEKNEIGSIIALGIVIVTPNVVKMMKQVFGAPQAGFGPIMEGLTTGFAMVSTPTKLLGGKIFGQDRQGKWGPGSRFLRGGLGTSLSVVNNPVSGRIKGSARLQRYNTWREKDKGRVGNFLFGKKPKSPAVIEAEEKAAAAAKKAKEDEATARKVETGEGETTT